MLFRSNETSARPSGARPDVPAKMTSSILPPRSVFAPCSPITQLMASTTLDLPDPFGPTTQVIPGSSKRVVEEAKDLKPLMVRLFKYTRQNLSGLAGRTEARRAVGEGNSFNFAAAPATWLTFSAICGQ